MALFEFDGKRPVVPSDSFVHPNAVLIGDVRIGHECLIAPGVAIRAEFGPIEIGNRSNVQDNSVIHVDPHARVIIEEDVIVAAGSFVPKGMNIPAGKLVSGNPAEIIRDISEKQKMTAKEGIDIYCELCKKYIETMKHVL
jgi:carbonic anhydrase/acetyltransferase-like protein (isoleucine patch superfamily)